jgi:hypothetical protein
MTGSKKNPWKQQKNSRLLRKKHAPELRARFIVSSSETTIISVL